MDDNEMDDFQRRRALRELRDTGLIRIDASGHYVLTAAGELFLDSLVVLQELDDRPGAARASSPGRVAPRAQPARTEAPPTARARGMKSDAAQDADGD